jgi:hypothetical protein
MYLMILKKVKFFMNRCDFSALDNLYWGLPVIFLSAVNENKDH